MKLLTLDVECSPNKYYKFSATGKVCENCGQTYFPRLGTEEMSRFCARKCQMSVGLRYDPDASSYSALHRRVYKKYGKASEYPCFTGCCRPARQWASMATYAEIDGYVPMCVPCHKINDLAFLRGVS